MIMYNTKGRLTQYCVFEGVGKEATLHLRPASRQILCYFTVFAMRETFIATIGK